MIGSMAARDTALLWNEFFRDPSLFWDNRHDKSSSYSPDFRHKKTRKVLWVDSWFNPPFVKAKLKELNLPTIPSYDRIDLLNLIKTYEKEKNLFKIRCIHDDVIERDLISKDVYVATALLGAYAKCGNIETAKNIFKQIPVRNVVAWTALISGYVEHGLGHDALKCFKKMQNEGIHPNIVTYVCALKACGIVRCLEVGEVIEAEVRKQEILQKDVMLGTALVDMFAKCGSMKKAQEVFNELPIRNIVSWTALIAGYAEQGLINETLKCFKQMQNEGISPNGVTYACLLKAYGTAGSREIVQDIEAKVRKQGLLQKDLVLGNALIIMYAKCGALDDAQNVLEQLSMQDVVSWTSLIYGYAEHGFSEEALEYFRRMQDKGIRPSIVTYICILKACGNLGSLEVGEGINIEVRKQGLLEKDIMLSTTLVGMYAKCGALKKAQEVFEEIPVHNVVSWTSLMAGYAQLGQTDDIFELYRKMRKENIVPNSVTFTVLLTAFSHGGLLEEGKMLLDEMCFIYDLTPELEHYACMMDLFGRAGCFNVVEMFLEKVSSEDRLPLFLAILGACLKWNNVKLGRWAFEQSVLLDGDCGDAYVCMENICASQSQD